MYVICSSFSFFTWYAQWPMADSWVYMEIQKGMYGLPQVSILANQLLEQDNMHDMKQLTNALKEHYTVAVDMTGSLFFGIQLTWNYTQGHIDCQMPGYINKALTKYQHPKPVTPQHAPYKVAPMQYGA